MQLIKRLFSLALLFLLITPLSAQFRSTLKKANKQYELHAYNLAIPTYLEALEKRSDNVEALLNLADCYRMVNEMENAAQYYARAVRLPGVEPIHFARFGQVLKAVGRYDEAKHWFLLYARYDEAWGNHFARSCDFALAQQAAAGDYQVVNAGINSFSSDFLPTIVNNQVVYSSARSDVRRPNAAFGGTINNQLFITNIEGEGILSNPNILDATNTTDASRGPVAYAPDGRWVAFTVNNFVDGTRQIPEAGIELSLYFAEINSYGQWVNIVPAPFNIPGTSVGYPCFSADGQQIYFASNQEGGQGGFDLYVSERRAPNSWSVPINLGPGINSPGNEITPFLDGDNLYFSSDYHPGMGGFDIFRTVAEGNQWGRIFHLGNAVNSSRDDYGFVYSQGQGAGYLTSNRPGGRGFEDIYRLSRAADNLTLRVLDSADGRPVSGASVDFAACGGPVYSTDPQGGYVFQAMSGASCQIAIGKVGYNTEYFNLTNTGLSGNEIVIRLTREGDAYPGRILEYGSQVPLEGVYITATDAQTGQSLTTYSSPSGDYSLALLPQRNYVIRFSKAGYRDSNLNLPTGNGQDRSRLGIIALAPIGAIAPQDPPTVTVPPAPTGGGVSPTVRNGYAIQLAAITSNNVTPFNDVANMGELYTINEGGRNKVRLGSYATREQADAALSLVKDMGYPGAFVVQEGGPVNVTTPTVGTGSGNYKIQLAAYRNPQYFDPSKVETYGYVEERMKGNLHVKYLAGFATLADAEAVLPQIKAAGFKTAYVVVEENGVLKKVQ